MAKDPNVVRVNRDDLREMLKGGYIYGDQIAEQLATEGTFAIAKWALGGGVDVVLDNTNCSIDSLKVILDNVEKSPFDIEVVFKVFDIPYWKQRWRNFYRVGLDFTSPRYIPASVAREKTAKFQEVKAFIKEYESRQ